MGTGQGHCVTTAALRTSEAKRGRLHTAGTLCPRSVFFFFPALLDWDSLNHTKSHAQCLPQPQPPLPVAVCTTMAAPDCKRQLRVLHTLRKFGS